ncbi:MAG: class I SAM-dependent methyltransferase [Alphaproteobacteria bacterium]|nr:class I SAM-dependent methyltransferase [Alphaproteobacteria bacterium]
MRIYERWMLPWLIDLAMRNDDLSPYRRRVLSRAHGRVLEIGVGSGLNLQLYPAAAEQIIGIDPSAELLAKTQRRSDASHRQVHLIRASAEAIPVQDRVVDTVVMTWTLCSIPDVRKALREIHRVLKPSGQLLFVEHGLAPEVNVQKWQHRLDPLWNHISCHLDRPMDKLIADSGFRITDLQTGYLPRGPKLMTFLYEGQARPI